MERIKKEQEEDNEAIRKYSKYLGKFLYKKIGFWVWDSMGLSIEEQEMRRKEEVDKKNQLMQARLDKMKEQVFDKQENKEKEEELKLLKAVLKREEREKIIEK